MAIQQQTRIETVLGCTELEETLSFFTQKVGFAIDVISPADNPQRATLSGHGSSIVLLKDPTLAPGRLRLVCQDPAAVAGGKLELVAPNGTIIELAPADAPLEIPDLDPTLVVSRIADSTEFGIGRAGMRYRDLIPGRHGGRFIASHILISDGGPVPDYVHHHGVRFQLIFCHAGWVEVVYEDQGPPFVLQPGDCVLQPPHIRHRVLRSSAGLEVVEIGCPAVHDTLAEHEITLPTSRIRRTRDFGGQRFVRHVASDTPYVASQLPGFEHRETGVDAATDGLAGVRVVRRCGDIVGATIEHGGEFWFAFVRNGSLTLDLGESVETFVEGDSLSVPAGCSLSILDASVDAEFLNVTLPA